MTRTQSRRFMLTLAFIATIGVIAVLIGIAFQNHLNVFLRPTQVLENPPTHVFNLGGFVQKGSVQKDAGLQVSFLVIDDKAAIPVVFEGILPDLFKEGQAVVATGRWQNGVFTATKILAKHDENYKPAGITS